jgi:hypothetical protein
MLRPIKNVLNYRILATDGEISGGKKVVLSTAWISSVAPERETVVMNIEKKRIQEAPEYKPDADFSRDYETRLHDYYRFPYYWL